MSSLKAFFEVSPLSSIYSMGAMNLYISFYFNSDLYSRELLDEYLSRALGVELEDGRLTLIDNSEYVLTIDYTIKMLNIHERSVTVCTEAITACSWCVHWSERLMQGYF